MDRNLNDVSEIQLHRIMPQRIEKSIKRLLQSGFQIFYNFNDAVNRRLV